MDLGVGAWHQLRLGIRDIDFHQQRMRSDRNRVTVTYYCSIKLLVRKSAHVKRCLLTIGDLLAVSFWNCHECTDHIDLRHAEQFKPCTAVTGVDQVSYIRVALRDDAGERCSHPFKA